MTKTAISQLNSRERNAWANRTLNGGTVSADLDLGKHYQWISVNEDGGTLLIDGKHEVVLTRDKTGTPPRWSK